MGQNVANTLDVDEDRSIPSHHMAIYIIIEGLRGLGLEVDLNFDFALRRNYSRYRVNSQRISIFDLPSNWLFVKVESQRDIFHVLDANDLFVFATNQQRTKVDLTHVKKYIRLLHTTHHQEILSDFLTGDFKNPIALVGANEVRSIFKDHFWFFSTQNSAFLSHTPEETRVWSFIFIDSFPLEIVSKRSWVDYIEPFGIFNLCPQRLKLNNVVFGLNIWLFISIVGRSQFKVTDRSLSLSVQLDDQFFMLRV